jgi:hypothetical protein
MIPDINSGMMIVALDVATVHGGSPGTAAIGGLGARAFRSELTPNGTEQRRNL